VPLDGNLSLRRQNFNKNLKNDTSLSQTSKVVRELFLGVFSQDQHSSGTKPTTTRNQWEKLGKVSHFYQPPFFGGKKKNTFWFQELLVESPESLWSPHNFGKN